MERSGVWIADCGMWGGWKLTGAKCNELRWSAELQHERSAIGSANVKWGGVVEHYDGVGPQSSAHRLIVRAGHPPSELVRHPVSDKSRQGLELNGMDCGW